MKIGIKYTFLVLILGGFETQLQQLKQLECQVCKVIMLRAVSHCCSVPIHYYYVMYAEKMCYMTKNKNLLAIMCCLAADTVRIKTCFCFPTGPATDSIIQSET